MKDSKYIPSMGLAFSEKKEMEKLGKQAKKGWLLEDFSFLGYRLKKGEPADVTYALDYQKQPDDDYFDYFAAADWKHICSANEEIHIFQAPAGTEPIYSDPDTEMEKYQREKKTMGKVAFPALLAVLLSFLLAAVVQSFGWTDTWEAVFVLLGTVSFIVLVFSGMPYIAYQLRLLRWRKR